ncbi:MAG: glycoside hydrolase family 127 protein [Draconibacterium sp.]
MFFKYSFIFFTIVFITVSCGRKEKFPEIKFERITREKVEINYSAEDSTKESEMLSSGAEESEKAISDLLKMKEFYVERDQQFNLDLFEKKWAGFNIYTEKFNTDQLMEWIDATGYLLELTGDNKYGEALEDLIYQSKFYLNDEVKNLVKSFIYTKNVDHIQLNMFVNSTIEYNHTLGGTVKITQDNDFPESGKLIVTFNVTEHPYVELFIRIPSWAKGATVTALSVKYVATPGEYCQIARKWKDGDTVEILLPIEKRPKN